MTHDTDSQTIDRVLGGDGSVQITTGRTRSSGLLPQCVGESALGYFLIGLAFHVGMAVAESWALSILDTRTAQPMPDMEPPEAEIPVLVGIAVVTILGVLTLVGLLLGRSWPIPSRARCHALSTAILVIGHAASLAMLFDDSGALAVGSGVATIFVGIVLALVLALRGKFGVS